MYNFQRHRRGSLSASGHCGDLPRVSISHEIQRRQAPRDRLLSTLCLFTLVFQHSFYLVTPRGFRHIVLRSLILLRRNQNSPGIQTALFITVYYSTSCALSQFVHSISLIRHVSNDRTNRSCVKDSNAIPPTRRKKCKKIQARIFIILRK